MARLSQFNRAPTPVSLALIVAMLTLIALAAPAAAQPAGTIANQRSRSNTLELAPQLPQTSQIPAPRNSNVRVIPVIPPSQSVLVLPHASRDFLGRWGGYLFLTRRFGHIVPPTETGMSLVFGERNGQVVMATYVYAGPSSQILSTSVDSAGPRSVTVKVAGVTLNGPRTLRHLERFTLTLAGHNLIECAKHVDIYVSGWPNPIMEAVYKGKLHPISKAESTLMAEEAARAGEVPQRRIEQGHPPPLP